MIGGNGNSDDKAIRESEKERNIMCGVPLNAYNVF
jgi:hypothetical protein